MNIVKKIFSILKSKSGAGSIYLGFVMVMISFIGVVASTNLFEIYNTSTHTQMSCDIIADGAAMAGQTPLGFNENRMNAAAEELIDRNHFDDTFQSFDIQLEDEINSFGAETGNKLITTSIKTTASYFMPGYLYDGIYEINADATVRAIEHITVTAAASSSLYDNPTGSLPFEPSYPDTRNGSYTNWFLINYLNPQYNAIYEANGVNTKTHIFIYDYLRCMGFDEFTPRTTSELAAYFGGPALSEGWVTLSDSASAQSAADSGKPVVIIVSDAAGNADIYAVVPQSIPVEDGEVMTAHVGEVNWNYKATSLISLKAGGKSVLILTHD